MPFPQHFLSELEARNGIEDVVSQYVRLSKRSGSNLFGLCPFHSEKTPSFSVSPDKQMFYCFGCGKGGGAVSFIMEIENLGYADAVRHLARRAGLTVPDEQTDTTRPLRERMLALNQKAARFFYDTLMGERGQPARAYIDGREITRAMVLSFGLGYAPDSWTALTDAMKAQGFTEDELTGAGLARRRSSGGVYDTFRSRLMFPVIDVRGDVIGFSGRIIGEGEPKYMNSPETLVFNKSRNLFGLNLAKKSKRGYIILSEGNIDVVALHGAGFDSAVASLGTSLTAEQARLISRYAKEAVIAYDSDEAGKKAASRAIELLEKLDIGVRVLDLGSAKDPDEFIKAHSPEAFQKLLDGSENHVEYKLSAIASRHQLNTDEGRVGFLKEAAQMLAAVYGNVEREVYGIRAAEMAGIPPETLAAEIKRIRSGMRKRAFQTQQRAETQPERTIQPGERALTYTNVRSAQAEEGIVRILYNDPAQAKALNFSDSFSSPLLGRFCMELKSRILNGESITMDALSEVFSSGEISHLTRILQKPENLNEAKRKLNDYIAVIAEESEAGRQVAEKDLLALAERHRQKNGAYKGNRSTLEIRAKGDEAYVR